MTVLKEKRVKIFLRGTTMNERYWYNGRVAGIMYGFVVFGSIIALVILCIVKAT